MKRILHIFWLLLLFGVLSTSASAQMIRFKSYRAAQGTSGLDKNGLYAWGPWGMNSSEIMIDLTNESIYIENVESKESADYKIFGKPKKWIIKRQFKYVSFECADQNFDKVNVKLYEFDSGEFRISVMSLNKAVRYSAVYLDQKNMKKYFEE
ncbi:MAG TPA: hypothetical protein PLN63_09130 [Paludibacteraceae bacterium]|jgi:hypothetical protein|nr:hypothetical protein [Paludibacteraceae bacterium]